MAAERSPETLEDYRVLVNELRAQLVIAEGGSAAQAFKRAWSGIIAREKSKTFGVLRSRWGKAKILEARAREQAKHEEAMEAAKQEKWAAQKRERNFMAVFTTDWSRKFDRNRKLKIKVQQVSLFLRPFHSPVFPSSR